MYYVYFYDWFVKRNRVDMSQQTVIKECTHVQTMLIYKLRERKTTTVSSCVCKVRKYDLDKVNIKTFQFKDTL